MSSKTGALTAQQISAADFLKNLVILLRGKNLSKLDLRTCGDAHKCHSALVENYEINIARTPVYTYPTKWYRVFCWGKWKFEPGKYERYELNISENIHNKRQVDYCDEYPDGTPLGNVIIQAGTMASDAGYYLTRNISLNYDSDNYEDLYVKQNAHLFAAARELYNVLDTEYERRRRNCRLYILPELKDENAQVAMRRRLMENLQRKL